MKSLMLLWKEVADELATWCCTSTTADYKKLCSRVEHEGTSFLTITLPEFAKDFERSLDEGRVDSCAFSSFKRKRGLPMFLSGFLCQVFNPGTGRLLSEPSIDSIFAIRQLTLMFGKILLECTSARTEKAMRQFIECEREVRLVSHMTDEDYMAFTRLTSLVLAPVLSRVDNLVYEGELLPRHGPGKTADRLLGNKKYDLQYWPERLDRVFRFSEYAVPSLRYGDPLYQRSSVDFAEPGEELPVKVVPVPKTLKTPRIIAIEPTAVQFMQQSLREPITRAVEEDDLLSQFIGFEHQEPNRALACRGSMDGSLATLDLSEASDRVSNQHVRRLLARHPHLFEAVDATRSRKADVLGKTIRLAKFASMGSALCFPFEAMVFLIICLIGIEKSLNRQLTRRDLYGLVGQVRVYGDDIIVPVDSVRHVIDELSSFGLKVNIGKSFWTGKFRESCGGDFYDGEVVRPIRVRRIFPTSREDAQELISMVSLRNQLYDVGLWSSARWLDNELARWIPGYTIVPTDSAALGRHSVAFPPKGTHYDQDTQSLRMKALVPVSKLPASKASGEGSLLKCLLSLEWKSLYDDDGEPAIDNEHLERSGRPVSVNTQRRWVPLPGWARGGTF